MIVGVLRKNMLLRHFRVAGLDRLSEIEQIVSGSLDERIWFADSAMTWIYHCNTAASEFLQLIEPFRPAINVLFGQVQMGLIIDYVGGQKRFQRRNVKTSEMLALAFAKRDHIEFGVLNTKVPFHQGSRRHQARWSFGLKFSFQEIEHPWPILANV